VLTRAPWQQQVSFAGVNIVGARIEGYIDLQHAKLERPLFIGQCRVENNINLDGARTSNLIGFVSSRVRGNFNANQLHGEKLDLQNSQFKQDVGLSGAKIDANVEMHGATFEGDLWPAPGLDDTRLS
jgi:hypothetical protein